MYKTVLWLVLAFAPLATRVVADTAAEIFSLTEHSRLDGSGYLAELLPDDPDRWPLADIEALVASGKPRQRVFMDRDVDVMLMYWTTSPVRGGELQFHADIDDRNPAALVALDAPQQVIGIARR